MTASLKSRRRAAQAACQTADASAMPEDLLQTVWNQLAPQLARLIAALGIGHGLRDDVLQDVYLAAWQKRPAGLDAVQLRRWLVRVTVNRCKLEQRRRSQWQAKWFKLAGMWSGQATDDWAGAQNREDRQLVQQALERLEPDTRGLLVLRYFMELDSTEIAKILERPAATIRGRLRQARLALADELKRAGYKHE